MFKFNDDLQENFIPHLRPDTVRINDHFQKMNQDHPVSLFSSKTVASVNLMIEKYGTGKRLTRAITFADFCTFIEKWWLIVSNRDDADLMLEKDNDSYKFLKSVNVIFSDVKFWNEKENKKEPEKQFFPVQKSIIMLNTSLMKLCDDLAANDPDNRVFAAGHICGDYVELQFSVIKSRFTRLYAAQVSSSIRRASLCAVGDIVTTKTGNVNPQKTNLLIDPKIMIKSKQLAKDFQFNFEDSMNEPRHNSSVKIHLSSVVNFAFTQKGQCRICITSFEAPINEDLFKLFLELERLISLNYQNFKEGRLELFLSKFCNIFLDGSIRGILNCNMHHTSSFIDRVINKYAQISINSRAKQAKPLKEQNFGSKGLSK